MEDEMNTASCNWVMLSVLSQTRFNRGTLLMAYTLRRAEGNTTCNQMKIGLPVDPGVPVIQVYQSSPCLLSPRRVQPLPFDLWDLEGPSNNNKQTKTTTMIRFFFHELSLINKTNPRSMLGLVFTNKVSKQYTLSYLNQCRLA